ncbi:MAG: hypothetical protein KGJ78_02325 [Alphaproteobacteria bacterium]|nr:hypothetical protein [Alphaproteobacteria bacterium]
MGLKRVLAMGLAAGLSAILGPAAAAPPRDGIVTYVLENQNSSVERDVPVTFGAIFARGDVPAGTSIAAIDRAGHAIPMQVDVKAHHGDGSLRHAVLTLDVPRLTDHDFAVEIVHGEPAAGAPVPLDTVPANFDMVVDLTEGGNHLKASARDLIAHAKPETWLSGPLVGEWWFAGPLRDAAGRPDPHLSVRFGIRSYGKDRAVRVEVDVENTWTWIADPRTRKYDATILIDGKPVFTKAAMSQLPQTRWRKVYWLSEAPTVYVKQDLAYLRKTGIIPNYDPDAKVTESDIAQLYAAFSKRDRDPLATGIVTGYMPMTGGRMDIGPLPTWTVDYLLTMDRRAAQVMFSAADLGGSFRSHYRNEKTGRPTTTEEYPNISSHGNLVGKPGNLPKPDWLGEPPQIVPQSAHEPSLDFIPYVVSGERYYVEELEFWSQFNSWGTAPGNHGFRQSLVKWDEVRGQAWSLRTLAQAAYIVPDSDPMKATLLRELKANIDWYNQNLTNNPGANIFHTVWAVDNYAPWMDDFLTWSAGYVAQLGFDDIKPFAKWKGVYPVQRMINPQFCWILATTYNMALADENRRAYPTWSDALHATERRYAKDKSADPDAMQCGSGEMQKAFRLKAGEMDGGAWYGTGYPANMQPALAAAVDAGTPGAEEAWEKFRARPIHPIAPTWDILPLKDVK